MSLDMIDLYLRMPARMRPTRLADAERREPFRLFQRGLGSLSYRLLGPIFATLAIAGLVLASVSACAKIPRAPTAVDDRPLWSFDALPNQVDIEIEKVAGLPAGLPVFVDFLGATDGDNVLLAVDKAIDGFRRISLRSTKQSGVTLDLDLALRGGDVVAARVAATLRRDAVSRGRPAKEPLSVVGGRLQFGAGGASHPVKRIHCRIDVATQTQSGRQYAATGSFEVVATR